MQPRQTTAPVPPTPRPSRPGAGETSVGRPSRERTRNGALMASLAAVVALGTALAFTIGKGGGHGTTTTELVKTEAPARSPGRDTQTAAAGEAPRSRSPQGEAARSPSLTYYSGSNFSMSIPSGWVQDVDEKQLGEEDESKWSNGPDEYVLLDIHTPTHLTSGEDAEPVHERLAKQAGYAQIDYGPGDLSRHPESWMWIFEVEGDERIDYFFETCGNTIGVLGSTTPSRFGELRSTFVAVANSFRSSCE